MQNKNKEVEIRNKKWRGGGGEVLHRMQVKDPEKGTVTTCNHGSRRTSTADE